MLTQINTNHDVVIDGNEAYENVIKDAGFVSGILQNTGDPLDF
jgi:hypothetical protein